MRNLLTCDDFTWTNFGKGFGTGPNAPVNGLYNDYAMTHNPAEG